MKTTRLGRNAIGFSALLALAVGLSSSAFAGPGPQFWAQQAKNQAEAAKKAESKKAADAPEAACTSCKTTDIREPHSAGDGGKPLAYDEVVGTKHECSMCGTSIMVVRGKVTDNLKGTCPTCAKAAAGGGKANS